MNGFVPTTVAALLFMAATTMAHGDHGDMDQPAGENEPKEPIVRGSPMLSLLFRVRRTKEEVG